MTELRFGEVPIDFEGSIVTARRSIRDATTALGFGITDVTRLVTAASELARNIVQYARAGVMKWRIVESGGRVGIELDFEDQGPGIADLTLAFQEGYSTGKGLGMGLPGAKRLVDEMEVHSETGRGTHVRLRKWMRK